MKLYFLSDKDLLDIHDNQIQKYGGKIGIRD